MPVDRRPEPEYKTEKVEVEIPAAALVIRHARCANGCLIMAPDVPINGHPSIHTKIKHGDHEGDLYLDAAYGSFAHRCDMELKDGTVVEFHCPQCGVSLQEAGHICQSCSAPLFVIQLPKGGRVEGCTRKGCFSHKLEVMDLSRQLLQLFDDTQMDAYL